VRTADPVTLGEGGTPLVEAHRLADGVLIKNEAQNPTASFKDRPVAVAATMARELGLEGLLCASTGNTAAAVAAYGARAGLPVRCFVPAGTPAAKLAQARAAGAQVALVNGSYSDAHALAARAAERAGWANLTSTYVNPYMLEGDKTLGFELWEQLGGRTPDWVVVPIGAGPLLAAVAKAWEELLERGLAASRPRLLGVQASGCAPIVRAFQAGAERVGEWDGPVETVASSIGDPLRGYAADGTRTLRAIRRSGGAAVGIPEPRIFDAVDRLGRLEGVLAEPGAAAALAGYELGVERGLVSSDHLAVVVVTGHGLKDLGALSGDAEDATALEPGDEAAAGALLEASARG
jgi:threonine synthase